jgi:signal transduction histidine kinase
MNINSETRKQILATHDLFWESLAVRDIDKRFSVCADDITFIGTGLDERAIGKKAYKEINEKGIEQAPDPFNLTFKWKHLSVFENTAWVESQVIWMQEIKGITYKELVRNTTILKNENNKWWIVHVHGSAPDFRLQGENYMTNEKTLARNHELEKQVYERTKELNETLDHLKAAQAQLIQSAKMASLGELTAGIAHEIQNPLNFVNNFSDVSVDLVEELNEEIENGNTEDVISIGKDLKENLEKISHHGKRASSIVKGMLEHSRVGDGQKELTDINQMADEYLRLAYHGLRAKDKAFNATFKTEFDETIPKIKVIPQDISRVLLNLINNAFFACAEKSRITDAIKSKHMENKTYVPTVIVSTKEMDNKVKISVKDNGNGIPQDLLNKIFQPFFTTKPTGQGTGLGLSMSYDIITHGHNGELLVNTKHGEGSEFIIVLPINQPQ